jgi:hypothetical protein
MEQRFEQALGTLQKHFLDAFIDFKISIRFALIGGLAMSAWGVVRATADIDLLAHSDPSPLRNPGLRDRMKRFLEARACTVEWRTGDPDDPIPLLLRVGVPSPKLALEADVLWAHKRWQGEALRRAVILKLSEMDVPVLHPEDLILLKLEAGGPQDLLDVEGLLLESPPNFDISRLKEKASRLRLGVALEKLLRRGRSLK